MKAIHWMLQFYQRVRYPASLPSEIAVDLGLVSSHFLSFDDLFLQLTNANCSPKKLKRFMYRDEAEMAFRSAQKQERFGRNSLFSYYFKEGWLEFSLHFDEESRLRRIYLQHQRLKEHHGIEIHLTREPVRQLTDLRI